MKHLQKTVIAAGVFASTLMASAAQAEVTANVGLLSEYHFRGIVQNSTATANGGVDYSSDGFYAGVWAADLEDGLEIDLYGGYGFEFDNGLSLSAGLTTYIYTGDFDSGYDELNLGAAFGKFSVEYTIGKWDGVVGNEDETEADYTFLGLTFEHEGFSATFGAFGDEFEGEYLELGYGFSYEGFDLGVALISSGSDLDNDESLYFSIGRSFGL